MLAITTEALAREPAATMAGIFSWLGVDPTHIPPNLDERVNETPEVVTQVRGTGLAQRFRHSAFWNALGPRVPASLRRFGRRLAIKSVERSSVEAAAARRHFRPIQRPQVAALEELLGRKFPEWTSLYGSD